jgi:Transposase IS116/IS110/IS902 family
VRALRRRPAAGRSRRHHRFPSKAHFASWNGTAPTGASSGDQARHRLSRGGNRQINRALHIMAVVQLRNPTEGRAYYDRKVAAGKTPMEAMRALKRRLSDIACHQMITDARATATVFNIPPDWPRQATITGRSMPLVGVRWRLEQRSSDGQMILTVSWAARYRLLTCCDVEPLTESNRRPSPYHGQNGRSL